MTMLLTAVVMLASGKVKNGINFGIFPRESTSLEVNNIKRYQR